MKKETIIILGLFIAFLLIAVIGATAQDSIKVKITKIRTRENMTHVWMKNKEGKYKTVCFCKVPFKEKDIVTIKKPE